MDRDYGHVPRADGADIGEERSIGSRGEGHGNSAVYAAGPFGEWRAKFHVLAIRRCNPCCVGQGHGNVGHARDGGVYPYRLAGSVGEDHCVPDRKAGQAGLVKERPRDIPPTRRVNARDRDIAAGGRRHGRPVERHRVPLCPVAPRRGHVAVAARLQAKARVRRVEGVGVPHAERVRPRHCNALDGGGGRQGARCGVVPAGADLQAVCILRKSRMERDIRPALPQVSGQRNAARATVVLDRAYAGGAERNAAVDGCGASVQHNVGHPYRDEPVGDDGNHRATAVATEPVA